MVIKTYLQMLQRNPESTERIHRRLIHTALQWLFQGENYDVIQYEKRDSVTLDLVVLKYEAGLDGSFYDFMIVNCNKAGQPLASMVEQCTRQCENTDNKSKMVYAMIQTGIDVQFYQWGDKVLTPMSSFLHLQNDAGKIIEMVGHLKSHPLPFM